MLIFDGDNPFPDETCNNKRTRGGGLTGAKRCEYMDLCQQLTSRDPGLDYQPILARMFTILKEDVLEHIGTLTDQKTLVADIGTIFDGIPKDTSGKYVTTDYLDYLRIYNIVSFQIACLFTDYYRDVPNSAWNSSGIYTALIDIDYKNYSVMKTEFETKHNDFVTFYDPQSEKAFKKGITPVLYFLQLGTITISGIVEYLFNHIIVASLTYKLQYLHSIDSTKPLGIIDHDAGHESIFGHNYHYIDTILEGFLPYIKGLNLDKEHKYAVYFILFAFLHEADVWTACPEGGITRDFLIENLRNPSVHSIYLRINDHAMAIPSQYRVLKEGSHTEIKRKKVFDFFIFAIDTFMEHYTAFRATKGGKRRTTNKKKRKTARKKKTYRRSK